MEEDKTPHEDLESTQSAEPFDAGPTERVGRYRILQKIGEGGMGEVYLAEQERPIRRRVALKLIKLGMSTKAVIGRFEAERQALAIMNHPNVATVFDAGATEHGRPYFAMEFVKGEPITKYCDKHHLTVKERLQLFMQVCEGVQHAHQKGIIHRDIKPTNVLVSIKGDTPTPKIIDFGVAKATQQRLAERTVFTELGQLIGTPEYMSPEQAEMTIEDIDTRTDVYSLGVLLYELLVGVLPFSSEMLRQIGFDEMRRRIREEQPAKPSARISSVGERAHDSAEARRTGSRSLVSQIRGDLDWITMKALEKDRDERYASPLDLASDIDRHLAGYPVLACRPRTAYRVRKFVRRHRVALALGVVLGVVSFAAMISIGYGAAQGYVADREREVGRIRSVFTGLHFDYYEQRRHVVDIGLQSLVEMTAGTDKESLSGLLVEPFESFADLESVTVPQLLAEAGRIAEQRCQVAEQAMPHLVVGEVTGAANSGNCDEYLAILGRVNLALGQYSTAQRWLEIAWRSRLLRGHELCYAAVENLEHLAVAWTATGTHEAITLHRGGEVAESPSDLLDKAEDIRQVLRHPFISLRSDPRYQDFVIEFEEMIRDELER